MENKFNNWLESKRLKDTISNPNISIGDYTYYSGYYDKEDFEDTCVRYLLGDKTTKNYKEIFGEDFIFDKLIIVKFCSIGSGVNFILAGNQGHNHKWISTYPFNPAEFPNAKSGFQTKGDTIIGNDVWIGSKAIIMPGVKIANGAVIATGSIVTKDVPAYTIVAGNPAKPIKQRFCQQEIKQLLEIQWWNWSQNEINQALEFICSANINGLYEFYKNKKR